jgi:hypothetical protein
MVSADLIPTPQPGETLDAFLHRCMTDDAMQENDEKERGAICMAQWPNPLRASDDDAKPT